MPPELPDLPVPKGLGADASRYLGHHGILPFQPHARSSDYSLARSCEFLYYLRRRLGLCPLISYSAAKGRGTWFHHHAENFDKHPDLATSLLNQLLEARCAELCTACDKLSIIGEHRDTILENERRDFLMAAAYWQAALSVRVPTIGTLVDFLGQPHWRILGCELQIHATVPLRDILSRGRATRVSHAKTKTIDLVAQTDLLLFHQEQHLLFPFDFKTTDDDPRVRLSTCPLEFQTWHYPEVLRRALPDLVKKFDLPSDTGVGGMIHWAVQKPTIEFGQNDRDFREYLFTPSRGPNKGVARMEREYLGEPKFENYLQRCLDWYQGSGIYSDKRAQREVEPPVNVSFTALDPPGHPQHEHLYMRRLAYVADLATRQPWPQNFVVNEEHLRQWGKKSIWAPFYHYPPREWPRIIQQQGFVVSPRDADEPMI